MSDIYDYLFCRCIDEDQCRFLSTLITDVVFAVVRTLIALACAVYICYSRYRNTVVSSETSGRKFPEIYSNLSRNLLITYVSQLFLPRDAMLARY